MILSVALDLLWAESTSDSLLPMKSLGNNHSNAKAQTHLVGPQPAPPLSPQDSFSPCLSCMEVLLGGLACLVWHRRTAGISGMFKGGGEGWNFLISLSRITLTRHPELSLEHFFFFFQEWAYHKIH